MSFKRTKLELAQNPLHFYCRRHVTYIVPLTCSVKETRNQNNFTYIHVCDKKTKKTKTTTKKQQQKKKQTNKKKNKQKHIIMNTLIHASTFFISEIATWIVYYITTSFWFLEKGCWFRYRWKVYELYLRNYQIWRLLIFVDLYFRRLFRPWQGFLRGQRMCVSEIRVFKI